MAGRLIINGDDFGLTRSVTNAMLEVYRKGSLTSVSLMANVPGTVYAAHRALEHPDLGVGLHFTLTEVFPLTTAGELVDAGGRFGSRKVLLLKALSGRLKRREVLCELEAQYARLLDLGIRITHVDSHQHVHTFPVVFEAVRDFCIAHRLPARIPFTQTILREGLPLNWRTAGREAKHLLLSGMLQRCLLRKKSLRTNDSFNSVFDIYPSRPVRPEDYSLLIGKRKSACHEVMVHPYALSSELEEVYPDVGWREKKRGFLSIAAAEYEALSSFSIRDWLRQSMPDVELVHYGSLA